MRLLEDHLAALLGITKQGKRGGRGTRGITAVWSLQLIHAEGAFTVVGDIEMERVGKILQWVVKIYIESGNRLSG